MKDSLTSFAGAALEFLIHGAHARIIDGTELWDAVVIVDALLLNLDHRHALDLA